jgi:hypothetical protein
MADDAKPLEGDERVKRGRDHELFPALSQQVQSNYLRMRRRSVAATVDDLLGQLRGTFYVDGARIRKMPRALALWMFNPENDLTSEELLDLRAALVHDLEERGSRITA